MDDDIPSLAAVAYHRGDRSRRRKGECLPIGPEYRKLTRGERVVVRLKIQPARLISAFPSNPMCVGRLELSNRKDGAIR